MAVCGGCIYLCLGTLTPDHQAVLVKKAFTCCPGNRTTSGHPSRAAQALGASITPKEVCWRGSVSLQAPWRPEES